MQSFKLNLTRGTTLVCLTLAAAAVVLIARAADAPSIKGTLEDRAAIEDLLVDYYGGFSGDHKGFASFYVADGILDVNGIVAQGAEAINKLYSHSPAGPTRKPGVFRMLLTNIRISVNGSTAKADAIWTGIQDENIKAPPEFIEQGRERIYLDRFYNELSADPKLIDEKTRDHYAALYAKPHAMHDAFEQFAAFNQDAADNKGLLAARGKVSMPVLAVGGEKSFGQGEATVLRFVASNVTQAIIPASGHWIMEENPKETVRLVSEFIGH